MTALLDRLPTWLKAAAWLAAAAFVDAVFNAATTGQVKVSPEWVPLINVALVAVRDYLRSRAKGA